MRLETIRSLARVKCIYCFKVSVKMTCNLFSIECLYKMINERIMANLREQSKSHLIQPVQNFGFESSIALI
jgi:hypothetical protein